MEGLAISPLLVFLVLLVLYVLSSIQILNEYERAVVFRLGKLLPQPKGPGVVLVFRPIDRYVRMSLRTVVLDVPPQDIITRDNVSVKVNAVVYFRVLDPSRAVVEVENYMYATSQLAQTTLRSVLGQAELDDLLAQRDRLNQQLQQILDSETEPWGIKVSSVEVKHVDLPQDMQRAMARQAEAEREDADRDRRGARQDVEVQPGITPLNGHDAPPVHAVHGQLERQPESLHEDQRPQRNRGGNAGAEPAETDSTRQGDDSQHQEGEGRRSPIPLLKDS